MAGRSRHQPRLLTPNRPGGPRVTHECGNSPAGDDDQRSATALRTRIRQRAAIVAAATLGLSFVGLAPARAHVEASAEGAQAGTGPVTVSFVAEAESATAGIVGVKTQLPVGIAPDAVSLASGPAGWTMTVMPDAYEVSGPDIGPGVDLEYGITVEQLPRESTELPLRTLLRYSDGREDAWIESPTENNPDPEMPAPTITVVAAPPLPAPPSSPAATSAAPGPLIEAGTTLPADTRGAAAAGDSSSSTAGVVGLAAFATVILAAGAWWWRRRAARQGR